MNNKSGSERDKLIEILKNVACKTYLGNHRFHHILNNYECANGYMVWEDLADYFLNLKKLCEEQKAEIDSLRTRLSGITQHGSVGAAERIKRLEKALLRIAKNGRSDQPEELWGDPHEMARQALQDSLGDSQEGSK